MTLRTRLERGIVVLLAGMPRFLQRLLAGRPREVDGQRLEPEVQLMLRLLELSGPALEELPVPEAREQLAHNAGLVAGPPIDVAAVESISIPGPGGPIDARLYTPHIRSDPAPLLVYFHGGGWVLGSLDTHDNAARFVADRAEIKVLSVDYRLAPEHPFPAAAEDAVAAFRFAAAEADQLGVDAEAIAVGGDSAGGNLAAVVCQQQAAEDGPMPAFQMLIYPVTDMSIKRRSY